MVSGRAVRITVSAHSRSKDAARLTAVSDYAEQPVEGK